jgi:hypothetical protein
MWPFFNVPLEGHIRQVWLRVLDVNYMKYCSPDVKTTINQSINQISLITSIFFYNWFNIFQDLSVKENKLIDINNRINSNFFCYDIEKYIYFFKIRQIIGNEFK